MVGILHAWQHQLCDGCWPSARAYKGYEQYPFKIKGLYKLLVCLSYNLQFYIREDKGLLLQKKEAIRPRVCFIYTARNQKPLD